MTPVIAAVLVFAGAGILAAALVPLSRLLRRLSPGSVRSRWILLRGLTFFFIAGYLGYAVLVLVQPLGSSSLVVALIFLFGSIFVYLSTWLSFETAVDIRRMSELELENNTDALTGVYNRRYLDRRLQEEFARARRYSLPLAVLLIDLDHFKTVNDLYGHPAGDAALAALAKLLHSNLRATDILARYGGDEFMVITVNTTGEQAYILAERLRRCAEDCEIVVSARGRESVPEKISLSIGVACCVDIGDVQGLVDEADRMMYRAKETGRNRTVAGKHCQVSSPAAPADSLPPLSD